MNKKYIEQKINFPLKPSLVNKEKSANKIYLAVLIVICGFVRSFNHDLNRGCLVYMFFLPFSVSKFLINLRSQFRVRNFFFV